MFAAASARLGKRFSPVRVGTAGGVLLAAGGMWLATSLSGEPSYLTAFLPAQLLTGVGAGLTIPTLVAIALAEVPPGRLSTGTAVYTTFRQIGSALGVAVWVATLGTSSLGNAASFVSGWGFIAVMGRATLLALSTTPRRSPSA